MSPLESAVTILDIPNISVRADGTTITLPQATFYIPSEKPVKVYKFNPQPLELIQIIENNTKGLPATFGIYIKNISTGQEISVNADEPFTAASLYKLAVMHTIYKKGADGDLNLGNPEIQQNLKAMIAVSSNEAARFLVNKYTSWDEITNTMHSLGLTNTFLNQDPFVTTPKDMGKLLELMALGKTVNLESSVTMLELMLSQTRNDRIPVHLPPIALVAHKTGELEDVKPVMSKISYEVYDFFTKQWANPPEIL